METQSVINQSPEACKKAIHRQIALCVALGVAVLALNIFLAILRTKETHTLMLVLNIVTDTLCGWFLFFYIHGPLLRRYRLCQLMLRKKTPLTGTVAEIRPETTRYLFIACLEVMVEGRRYYLPTNTIRLQPGQTYQLSIVNNVIVEAAQ